VTRLQCPCPIPDCGGSPTRPGAPDLTTLRHFALNIIKQDTERKVGVANARKRAGWDRAYLLQRLTAVEGQQPAGRPRGTGARGLTGTVAELDHLARTH
jgi:hypothetical protein